MILKLWVVNQWPPISQYLKICPMIILLVHPFCQFKHKRAPTCRLVGPKMESRPVPDHAITRPTGVSSGQVRIGMNMYSEVYNNRFKETIHQNQMNSHYRYEHEATREFAPSTEQVQNLQIYLWEGYKYWF